MESQKIINLLDHKDEDDSKFETKKWYIINDQNNGRYDKGDENESTVKFSTEVVKPFLVDYSDAYIFVTADIKVVGADDNTKAAFKNCHPVTRAFIHLNEEHACDNLDLTMNLYNMIDYSDNYADTTASLYHYKRPDQTRGDDGNIASVNNNSTSFKYQSELIKKQVNPVNVGQGRDPDVANVHRAWKNVKILVPLKYMSNFFRALELPLINTKLYTELNWTKHSVIRNVNGATTFQITKAELYVPVVTLNTENNNKLAKLLRDSFERSVIWNEYKSKIETITTVANEGGNTNTKIIVLDTSFQGVHRLLVLGFDNDSVKRNTADIQSHRRYYLPKVEIKDYNVLIFMTK